MVTRWLVVFFQLLLAATAWSQPAPSKIYTYFDEKRTVVSATDDYAYFRVEYLDHNVREDYYKDGRLIAVTTYADSTFTIKNGQFTLFYEDGGTKMEEGFYRNDTLHGDWFSWSEEGHLMMFGEYASGIRNGKWYYYTFDPAYTSGKPVLDSSGIYKNGIPDGPWHFYYKGDTTLTDLYEDGALISRTCERYEWDWHEGSCMPQPAAFKGGEKELQKIIRRELIYPKAARKQKIKGITTISFYVDYAGLISGVRVEKSSHPLLDAEALRVVQFLGRGQWTPAFDHNRPVTSRVSVSIEFR